MTPVSDKKITLAIESAIQGGSISLQQGETEIDQWIGTSSVSRAEDLLPTINKMLDANRIAPNDLDFLAVSSGPGSYTGIRIGLATALGLRSALNVQCRSISVLDAMSHVSTQYDKLVAAVPMGREMVCLQKFVFDAGQAKPSTEPILFSENAFTELFISAQGQIFILHGSLCERLREIIGSLDGSAQIVNVGYCLAGLVSAACRVGFGSEALTPLFVATK